ncbi:MAG: hypothetical protein QME05_01245 [Candidatus Margulisbacteria bacterium]|nr:hypothetical protein [Candidatus Margulisiibacteriota bacterium]
MIRVPGERPFVPKITPKEANKEAEKTEQQAAKPQQPVPSSIGRGPELDARAIAVRLSALATEAKKREISADEFKRVLDEVITLTGLKEPEAAMQAASKKLQEEIEIELQKIKDNKDLMEEAEDWQRFADLLERMGPQQAEAMLGMLKASIHDL